MEQTADKVIKLCRDKLGIEVAPSDISTAHRIKLKSDRGSNAAPIIVRFTRRTIRDTVYRLRFQLKNHKSTNKSLHIYINQDLTDKNRKLLAAVRRKLQNEILQSMWTSGCRILVKDNNDHVTVLTSLAHVNAVSSADGFVDPDD